MLPGSLTNSICCWAFWSARLFKNLHNRSLSWAEQSHFGKAFPLNACLNSAAYASSVLEDFLVLHLQNIVSYILWHSLPYITECFRYLISTL